MGAAAGRGPRRRTGPPDPELRTVRVCYDHLAGERGGGDSFPAAMATTFRPTERRSSSGWESTSGPRPIAAPAVPLVPRLE